SRTADNQKRMARRGAAIAAAETRASVAASHHGDGRMPRREVTSAPSAPTDPKDTQSANAPQTMAPNGGKDSRLAVIRPHATIRSSRSLRLYLPRGRRLAIVILCASTFVRCSDNPMAPSPPPAIALSCPAPTTVASATGLPVVVPFTTPTATGGTAPITTTCAPASGVTYPIGSTTVTCTAQDAKRQTATCSFRVTVTAPPRLSVTRYIAFGDSITEGFPHTIAPALLDPAPDGSYPAVLQALLRARYTAQTVSILDEGIGGELVATGVARLPGVLTADAAGALLMMEGANDLNQYGRLGVDALVAGLRQMVRSARARSMPVFVGTLLPERANGTPARAAHPELVVPT